MFVSRVLMALDNGRVTEDDLTSSVEYAVYAFMWDRQREIVSQYIMQGYQVFALVSF